MESCRNDSGRTELEVREMAYAIIIVAALLYTWILVRDSRKQRLYNWDNPIVRTVLLVEEQGARHFWGNVAPGAVTMGWYPFFGGQMVTFLVIRRNGDQERVTISKRDFRYSEYLKYLDPEKND